MKKPYMTGEAGKSRTTPGQNNKPLENEIGRPKTLAMKIKPVVTHILFLTTIFAIVAVIGIAFINPKAGFLTFAVIFPIGVVGYQAAIDSDWSSRYRELPKAKRIFSVLTIVALVVAFIAFMIDINTLYD